MLHSFSTPIGPLSIELHDNQLTHVHFGAKHSATADDIATKIQQQLELYFQNPKHQFQIKYLMQGTPFQQKVWQALLDIPSGKTLTYQQLANQLQTSPRAIGNACRANRLPIVIPCHRIVAKNHPGGFAGNINGPFLEIKQWLLQHETSR